MFPRHLNLSVATAAGTVNEIALVYSQTDSFTSSTGAAITPLNWRSDNPRSDQRDELLRGRDRQR